MNDIATNLPVSRETSIEVEGMNCASCVAHVENAVRGVTGVKNVSVNLARGQASVSFNPDQTDPPKIAEAITHSGYHAFPQETSLAPAAAEEKRLDRQRNEARAWEYRAIIGVVLWLPLEATHWILQALGSQAHHHLAQASLMGWAALICSAIAIIYVGGRFYSSAISALWHRTSNMDTLISMGATVAFGYSLVFFVGGMAGAWRPPMNHELFFMEATGLLALISIGHALEARARQSAGSAIRQLLQLTPDVALRLIDGSATETEEVPVASVHVRDRLLIRPGDRVPIDGVVIDGRSSIDESMITGEANPVSRSIGDAVVGGTINQDGRVIIRVSRVGSETALAQIVSLVERAQSTKPPVQKLADQISAVFVPSVLAIALLTGIAWYVWGLHAGWSAGAIGAQVARTVCSVLIIACPCALGLAVPATVMV
ncbi:MAG TPA: HAD-IC family P-type ATPase, partial [Bryobacteraceae bacterium]